MFLISKLLYLLRTFFPNLGEFAVIGSCPTQVMLFLGSGVSRPTWEAANNKSGTSIPDVNGITDAVLSGSWKWNQLQQVFEQRAPDDPLCEVAERCQQFLQRMCSRVSEYYMQQRGGSLNYEDLFYLIDQLRSTLINPAIQAFTEQVRGSCSDLCQSSITFQRPTEFDDLCKQACDFIQCVVWDQLRRDDVPIGMGLISDIVKRRTIRRITICTLNHDTLVETLLNGIDYEDGFTNLTSGGFFDAHRLRKTTKRIRLLKLHGSINWFRHQRREGEHYEDHYAAHKHGWRRPVTGNGFKWYEDSIPRILTGSYNKFEGYGTDIIKEYIHAFHAALDQHSLIVMSGYGWGDHAINQRLCEWLGRDRSRRIVLLHRDRPVSMLKENPIIWHQYSRLIRLRKIVVFRRWLKEVTTWDEIVEFIEKADRASPCRTPNPLDVFREG